MNTKRQEIIVTLTIPECWLCYLINGDTDYLSGDENFEIINCFQDFMNAYDRDNVTVCVPEKEAYFANRNDCNNIGQSVVDVQVVFYNTKKK